MYRLLALAFLFVAAACGGGDSPEPTATNAPANTTTSTQGVAGERTQTPGSPSATATPPGTYEVVDGDTLSEIAERFGTTVDALVELNTLASADDLQIGQVLRISAAAGTASPAVTTTTPAATATQ